MPEVNEAEPLKMPDELRPVDLFFRQQMKSKNAPEYVVKAWDDFLLAVSKWDKEQKPNG
jgi:hypothetical protein